MKLIICYRSSITGKFVTEEYAEANPNTTQRVTLKRKEQDDERD